MQVNRNIIGVFLFVITSLANLSCNKEEPIPAYIRIDAITVTTVGSMGSASHNITDAWLYVNDQHIGTFEMPFTVPVLLFGDQNIKVLPGIKENGISETRIPYPFYEVWESSANLKAGEIITLQPNTTYNAAADFIWMEEFEGAAPGVCDTSNSDTVMLLVNTPGVVFEGIGSAAVYLYPGNTLYQGITCSKHNLTQGGEAVFLEFDFKCNSDFNVGLVVYDQSSILVSQSISLSMRPTTTWKKIYANLTTEVVEAPPNSKFGIFFSMQRDESLTHSEFLIDNVKLIN